MTDDVRCIFRPSTAPAAPTRVVPRGSSEEAQETRRELADFLEANLSAPVHFSASQHQQRLAIALDTMSISERVYIEIEMQRQRGPLYSAEYDPL